MKTPSFNEHDTTLHLWLDDPRDPAVEMARNSLVAHLRGRGFTVDLDKKVDKLIRDHFHVGSKGDLKFKLDMNGRSIELTFYQSINIVNRNGGEYDFNKRQKMPYLIGKQYELERNKIAAMMAELGYQLTKKQELSGKAFIDDNRMKHCEFQGIRGEYKIADYNSGSADKQTLVDGSTIYTRVAGRWIKATAYHNINNMWWVLLPCGTVTNMASFDLFMIKPEALQGRYIKNSESRKKQLDASISKKVVNNIKRVTALRTILTPAESCYVISLKHTAADDPFITLWGQDGSGYRWGMAGAGKYSNEKILSNLDYYNSGYNIAVDAEIVERLATLSGANNEDMPENVPVVLNTIENWFKLLGSTIAKTKYPEVPKVMEVKPKRKRKAA